MADIGSFPATKADIQVVKADIQAVKADIQAVKADIQAVKEDTQVVKADIQALHGEIGGLRDELVVKIDGVQSGLRGEFKNEIQTLRSEFKGDIHRLAKAIVENQTEIREIKSVMATKDDISRVLSAIDSFARKGEAYDRKAVSHGAILTDHEDTLRDYGRRISRLEAKR